MTSILCFESLQLLSFISLDLKSKSLEILIEIAITMTIIICSLAIPIYCKHNKNNKNDKTQTLIDPSNTLDVSNLTFYIGKERILSGLSV
jgi:hypothetical protein